MGIDCDEIRDLLVKCLYGKPTPEQARRVREHISTCPACARIREKLEGHEDLLGTDRDAPLPDWAGSWDIIAEKALRRRSWFRLPLSRRLRLGVSLAAVFVVGLIVGRYLLLPPSGPGVQTRLADHRPPSAGEFAEQVDLLMVNFLNREESTAVYEMTDLERKIIDEILLQTRLLKILSSGRGDGSAREILEEVEIALVGISNLDSGDEHSARQIADFITRSRLRFRLQQILETKPLI
jgi:hypothetical protein